jgi:YgiT-type zinc finger domain-containing protein
MGTRIADYGAGLQEEETMKCVVCKQGETRPGTATVTLERNGLTLVIKGVPAQICENCGEEYIDESVTEHLLETAEEVAAEGTQVDIREYRAA